MNLIPNKESVILKITDDGEGVPEEKRRIYLNSFYSVEMRQETAGLTENGLGLYIAKRIIESAGRKYQCFKPWRVLYYDHTSESGRRTGADMREKILIVEDEEEIAMLEQDYLEINGFQTRIESDGEQAVELALTGEFDLILLDLMLPGKNGYDICREIRDKVDVPILMVTARTESIDKVLGLGLGADDYISKPFDPQNW